MSGKFKVSDKRPVGRGNIKDRVLNHDPTKNYKWGKTNYWGETLVQGLPPWRLWTGRMMLDSDPLVQFGLNVRNAALMPAEIRIKCKNDVIRNWLQEQWDFLWTYYKEKLTAAKEFGFSPLQVNWKMKNGLMVIKNVKDFAPEDSKCLQTSNRTIGLTVKGERVWSPQALWTTFGSKYGSPYGVGCLRRMYPAWYEKWMEHGAQRLKQLRMIKDAYIGDIFWYPMNLDFELPDGTRVTVKDVMREIGENRLSGAGMTLPRLYDDQGNKLTDYTPPQDVGGGSQIFEWVENCDVKMLQGADVPMEVVQASETGSGYSGRSIPFLAMLSVCNGEFSEILECVDQQILRVGAWLNWGGDTDYEIEPLNLVETFSDSTQGSPMGGEAIGGTVSSSTPQLIVNENGKPATTEQFAEKHKFSCLMFMVQNPLAMEIIELGAKIPSSDLYGTEYGNESGTGREMEPHCTIKYGIHTGDHEEVRKAIQDSSPVAIQIGKCSHFESEEYDVVKLEVESKGLHQLNAKVCESLECTDTFPDYKPHITIAYVKKGLGEFYANRLNTLQGKVAVFDCATFSNQERRKTTIQLTGNAQFKEGGISSNGETFQLAEKQPHEMRLQEWMKRKPVPKQRKLPESGTHPAIKTDDGTLHVDHNFEGRTHVQFAKAHEIPPERIVGGGWHVDGDYRETHRSDSLKHGEQARAKERVEHKKHIIKALSEDKKVHKDVLGGHPHFDSQHAESELDHNKLTDFASSMHDKHPGLKSLYLRHHPKENRIHLHDIQVHKEHRKQGVGSSVMEHLTKFADQHNHRISLTTATKDDHNGTTSSSRLKKFYGRFGFKKNKDLSVTASMMREPHSQHEEYQLSESEGEKIKREFLHGETSDIIRGTRARILELKKGLIDSLPELTEKVNTLIRELQPALAENLVAINWKQTIEGLSEVVQEIPEYLKEHWRPQGITQGTPPEPPETIQDLLGGDEPLVEFPALKEATEVLRQSPAMVGFDYRETAELVKQGAFAVTGDLVESEVKEIQDVLTDAMEDGLSRDRFIDAVVAKLETGKLSEARLETIFRTNALSAKSNANFKAVQQPLVSDAFPYVSYAATHDARVRDHHHELEELGLDGTNCYRIEDPTFIKFRPPWSYNCRCRWYPQTINQAANKGVKEAKEWVERAKAKAETEGGSFYQYLNDSAPATPEFVPVPSFEPDPNFVRQ